jgi:hypothetical protein
MTEPTKPAEPVKPVEDLANKEEKARKEKEERRTKEKDTVREQVDKAATAHDELGKKFLKEDAEEAVKKLKENEEKAKK